MDDVVRRAVHRLKDGKWVMEKDVVATEEPLSIDLIKDDSTERWVSILRTPGSDTDLVLGLLISEGILKNCSIQDVEIILSDGNARIIIPDDAEYDITPRGRISNGSACGICGRQDFADLLSKAHDCSIPAMHVDSELLIELPQKMLAVQSAFTTTGGIHAAGLFTADGEMIVVREDIGRHNCVDKVVGAGVQMGTDFSKSILCLSGRIGSELVLKAIAAGIPIVVAIGAASSMAVDLSRQAGVAIFGFTRNGSTVSYIHPSDSN